MSWDCQVRDPRGNQKACFVHDIIGYKNTQFLKFIHHYLCRTSMPRLTSQQREQAIGRLQAGESISNVANVFNVHITTIYRLQDRFVTTNSTADLPRSGPPSVTTQRQDRHIHRLHNRDPFLTGNETARQTIGVNNRPISGDTVRRRLRINNLSCRRPARRPVLTQQHRHNRLQWTTFHRNWRYQQWKHVIFTDETRVCISHADGRVRIWRRRGHRYDDQCVVERDPWGGPSVMIWAAIGLNQRLGPVVFQNIGPGRGNGITAQRYIDQALRPHIVPFFARHPLYTFQHDNARPHTARATVHFLQQHNIRILPWPALSADLNPIEHLWDELKRRIDRVRPRPRTAAQLQAIILQTFPLIPMAFINRLIHSMYRRCVAVVNANGGHTRY